MDHARLGCSSAYRWMVCPGSVTFEARFPGTTSAAAEEGTVAHDVHETALLLGCDAIDVIDRVPGSSVDMAERVQVSIDWIRAELTARPGATLLVERRLNPGAVIARDDLWGTADAVILDPARREILVVDLKFGMQIVDVETTPQLPLYGVGARTLADFPVAAVHLVITQPRAPHRDGPIRAIVRDPPTLDAFVETIREAAARTDDPDAPLVAGNHCGFCRAAGACPAAAAAALDAAETEFAGIDPDAPTHEALPPERIAELLHEAERVKAWAKALEAYALRIAEDGVRIPGWNLIRRKGKRAWNDPDAALAALLETYGVEADVLAPRVLRSPRQVELALKEAMRVKADLTALAAVREIGWKLAPDTAPGDDFVDAETEFADVELDAS